MSAKKVNERHIWGIFGRVAEEKTLSTSNVAGISYTDAEPDTLGTDCWADTVGTSPVRKLSETLLDITVPLSLGAGCSDFGVVMSALVWEFHFGVNVGMLVRKLSNAPSSTTDRQQTNKRQEWCGRRRWWFHGPTFQHAGLLSRGRHGSSIQRLRPAINLKLWHLCV